MIQGVNAGGPTVGGDIEFFAGSAPNPLVGGADVDPIGAIEIQNPKYRIHSFGQLAEFFFALAQGFFGAFAIADVHHHANTATGFGGNHSHANQHPHPMAISMHVGLFPRGDRLVLPQVFNGRDVLRSIFGRCEFGPV